MQTPRPAAESRRPARLAALLRPPRPSLSQLPFAPVPHLHLSAAANVPCVFSFLACRELSWDTMEPAGFFYISTLSTMGQIYFITQREEFSNEARGQFSCLSHLGPWGAQWGCCWGKRFACSALP